MKTFKTILSYALVILVLISSIGHSIGFHFCLGKIESMALFVRVKTSGEHDDSCDRDVKGNHRSLSYKGCCTDKTMIADTEKLLSKSTSLVIISKFLDVSFREDQIKKYNFLQSIKFKHHSIYRPPLLERDIIILQETFLI